MLRSIWLIFGGLKKSWPVGKRVRIEDKFSTSYFQAVHPSFNGATGVVTGHEMWLTPGEPFSFEVELKIDSGPNSGKHTMIMPDMLVEV